MDLGRICGVTFGDAVGAFALGLVFGATFLFLLQKAIRND